VYVGFGVIRFEDELCEQKRTMSSLGRFELEMRLTPICCGMRDLGEVRYVCDSRSGAGGEVERSDFVRGGYGELLTSRAMF
jgi:hypothetical protein